MTPVPKGIKPGRMKPKRLVDRVHRAYVAKQPCCCCGALSVEVHHLLRADPKRGMGRKAGDNFTVPLCPEHHRNLHMAGNEVEFLSRYCVDGLALAAKLWGESHGG